jgi:hypothetical protein
VGVGNQEADRAMLRFGVFATIGGWLVARTDRHELYGARDEAIRAAVREAHVARWRGADAEVVAQDAAGGSLRVVDPATPGG